MALALSDAQLQTLMVAAKQLEPDKRAVLLERLGAELRLRHRPGGRGAFHPSDDDIELAMRTALTGLLQGAAAAPSTSPHRSGPAWCLARATARA